MHQEEIATAPLSSAAPPINEFPNSVDSLVAVKDANEGHFAVREDRKSFASVKEDDCGTAQSFIFSNTSSLNQPCSNSSAIIDEDETSQCDRGKHNATMVPPQGVCCSCGNRVMSGQLPMGGIKRGRSWSLSDLKLSAEKKFKMPVLDLENLSRATPAIPTPGKSRIESLPAEILDCIFPLLAVDTPTNGYTPRNVDLMSCLLTSRTFYHATLPTLYGRVTFPHSYIFSKFLNRITEDPHLGKLVRRLDFSHFTSIGLGRTKKMNEEIQNLTSHTLLKCLDYTPGLREFLVQEHLEDDLNEAVIQKLFCDLPVLDAVDFCGASSSSFRQSIAAVLNPRNISLPANLSIRRICLHECNTLGASVFETILPRLPYLTHLDVCHTQITEMALQSIPKTARLTHLNLSKCSRLSGPMVVDFLSNHPAAKDTLIYLNLLSDISRYRLLSRADVEKLLPRLPSTLRALNLSGAKITSDHVPLLIPLTKHVEELGLGCALLCIADLNALFMPAKSTTESDNNNENPGALNTGMTPEEENWIPHTVTYLDITGISSVTPSSLFQSDSCVLLSSTTAPLGVLEIGDKLLEMLKCREAMSKRMGWCVKDLGRRGWYVRSGDSGDSGYRSWKMGAMGWGMRKIPMARGEVGGLYGHYMFKK